MEKHAVRRKRKSKFLWKNAIALCLCVMKICFGLFLWYAAFFIRQGTEASGEEDTFRPVIGEPPYRIAIDAGHGGSDPGAQGIVIEKDMTAETSEALYALLEADSNFIPLKTRENYDITAKPSERVASANVFAPDLLLSIHGNSAPEGSTASGFECYPKVPGREWHQESYYFAKQLSSAMESAGAVLRGHGGIRYIYYLGEVKQLVESNHAEVRQERSFTILEDANCPAVLAEQCFVTSESDVERFGSEEGCKRTARAYYEAICAYFETTPLL